MLAKLRGCLFGAEQQPSSSNSNGGATTAQKNATNSAAEAKRHSVSNNLPQGVSAEKEKQRFVRANDRAFNAPFNYATNFIKTSKYSLLTFLPRNLYQQFTRIANFYFLVLLGLQCFPQIASVPWMYTLVPLSFVLCCSAVKDAFDDLQRHRNDRQVNSRISYIVRNSRLEPEKWMDVRVGDIVRMENEHFIAADLLLLSTSEPHGLCYIETAELDGETNLKTRVALPETVALNDRLKDISAFDAEITCELPNNRLDHFEGRLEWHGTAIPLDNSNMLLRGCRLRNTRWCYGLVVFAGRDTKLMQNSGHAPTKRTSLDRFLNLLILGIVLFLLAMCLICTLMSGLWEHVTGRLFRVYLPWDDFVANTKRVLSMPTNGVIDGISMAVVGTTDYDLEEDTDPNSVGPSKALIIAALQFFSYMILLNTVVPISLYISVEMIRLAHSKFINNDIKMYDHNSDTPARARTSTLNEELGQVQYVFSDKTGTLTQNIMLFKKCSINGRSYGDVMTERGEIVPTEDEKNLPPPLDFSANRWHEPNFRFHDQTLLEDTNRGIEEVGEFWRLLAICHTVMPERKPGNVLEYQAQSPDEAALTSAARNFGFVFKSRTPKSITIEVNGREEVYEVLHILDFDNVRKRMSVLVRSATKTVLYCKGADTMILDRLSASGTSELLRSATLQHLDKFATDGLRTLCTAYKPLDSEYCSKWVDRLRIAQLDAQRKEQLVEALYEEMEQNMLLLGATAIEDKLQDGVPQTIATLAAANIKIWVLTGDKTETAINIGYSCRLLTEEMREVFIIDGKEEKEVEVQLKDIRRRICNTKQTQPPIGVSSFYPPPSTPIPPGGRSPSSPLDSPSSVKAASPPLSPNGVVVPPPFVPTENGTTMPTTFPPHFAPNGAVSQMKDGSSVNCRRFVSVQSPRNGDQMDNNNSSRSRRKENSANGAEKGMVDATVGDSSEDDARGHYALVINGESLAHALKRKYEKTFLDIGTNCSSVICCRVTPLQKAQVVDLVKRNVKAVTLAIGDGANDVNMIRTAHIGVGISGQEGMQAVLSSDFSIGQFRFLERLLLVHGRWSYLRMCKFLRYFFYKNFAYTLPHFWYAFFCGFSAQTVYDPVLISMYNLCFTALPVLAMGVFDQDVDEQYSLRFPRLYIPGQFNLFFNMRIFIYSIIHGMISSLVLFFVPFGALFRAVDEGGREINDYSLFAFTAYTALVLVVTGQIAFDTAYWTRFNCLVVGGSIGFYVLTVFVCYQIPIMKLISGTYNFGIAFRAVRIPEFWLSLLLICVILLVPMMANRFFWFDTHPSYSDRLRVRHRLFMEPTTAEQPKMETAAKQIEVITKTGLARRSLRSGYAFSHCSGFGELIAKGTLFKNMEHLRIPPFHLAHHHHDHHHRRDHSSRRHSLSRVHPETATSAAGDTDGQQILNPISLSIKTAETTAISSSTQFSPTSSNATTTTTLRNASANIQQKIRSILPHPPSVPNSSRSQHRHSWHHQPSPTRLNTVQSMVIEHAEEEERGEEEREGDEMPWPMITHIAVREEEEDDDDKSRSEEWTKSRDSPPGSLGSRIGDEPDGSAKRIKPQDGGQPGGSAGGDKVNRTITVHSSRPLDLVHSTAAELKHILVINADDDDSQMNSSTPSNTHNFVVNAEMDNEICSPNYWRYNAVEPAVDDPQMASRTAGNVGESAAAAAEPGITFVSKTRRMSSSSSVTSRSSKAIASMRTDNQQQKRVFMGKKATPQRKRERRESDEDTTTV